MNNKLTTYLEEYNDKMDGCYYSQQIGESYIITDDTNFVKGIIAHNVGIDKSRTDATIISYPEISQYANFSAIDRQNYAGIFLHDTKLQDLADEKRYSYTAILSPNIKDLVTAMEVYCIEHLNKFNLFDKAMQNTLIKPTEDTNALKVKPSQKIVIDHLIVGNVDGAQTKPKTIDRLDKILLLPNSVDGYCNNAIDLPNNSPEDMKNDDEMDM